MANYVLRYFGDVERAKVFLRLHLDRELKIFETLYGFQDLFQMDRKIEFDTGEEIRFNKVGEEIEVRCFVPFALPPLAEKDKKKDFYIPKYLPALPAFFKVAGDMKVAYLVWPSGVPDLNPLLFYSEKSTGARDSTENLLAWDNEPFGEGVWELWNVPKGDPLTTEIITNAQHDNTAYISDTVTSHKWRNSSIIPNYGTYWLNPLRVRKAFFDKLLSTTKRLKALVIEDEQIQSTYLLSGYSSGDTVYTMAGESDAAIWSQDRSVYGTSCSELAAEEPTWVSIIQGLSAPSAVMVSYHNYLGGSLWRWKDQAISVEEKEITATGLYSVVGSAYTGSAFAFAADRENREWTKLYEFEPTGEVADVMDACGSTRLPVLNVNSQMFPVVTETKTYYFEINLGRNAFEYSRGHTVFPNPMPSRYASIHAEAPDYDGDEKPDLPGDNKVYHSVGTFCWASVGDGFDFYYHGPNFEGIKKLTLPTRARIYSQIYPDTFEAYFEGKTFVAKHGGQEYEVSLGVMPQMVYLKRNVP